MGKSTPATVFAVTSTDPAVMVDQINAAFRDINITLSLLDGGFTKQVVTPTGVEGSWNAAELLGPLSISSTMIQDSAVTTLKIANAAVTEALIAANAITSLKLVDGAVLEAKLAANAVTTNKLADDAVTTAKIVDAAITEALVATSAITTTKITDNAITTAKIVAGAITTNKIAANAVTANEIAANTITAAQIAASTITATQIAAATITGAKIAAGTITASNLTAGTITANEIASGTITGAKIAANTITAANIAVGTISANEIATGAITTAKIAALAVTANEIAANTITAAKIASGTITSTQIAAFTIDAMNIKSSAITTAKIAAGAVDATKISVTSLSAISANLGTVTIGTSGALSSGQTAYNVGTGFWLEYNAGTPRMSLGSPTSGFTWDGALLTVTGRIKAGKVTINETGGTNLTPIIQATSQIAQTPSNLPLSIFSWTSTVTTVTTETVKQKLTCTQYNTTGPVTSTRSIDLMIGTTYGGLEFFSTGGETTSRSYMRVGDGTLALWANTAAASGTAYFRCGPDTGLICSDDGTVGTLQLVTGTLLTISCSRGDITLSAGATGKITLGPLTQVKDRLNLWGTGSTNPKLDITNSLFITTSDGAYQIAKIDGGNIQWNAPLRIQRNTATVDCSALVVQHEVAGSYVAASTATTQTLSIDITNRGFTTAPNHGFGQARDDAQYSIAYQNNLSSTTAAVYHIKKRSGAAFTVGEVVVYYTTTKTIV